MSINRNKLYTLLFISCLAGYIYLYISLTSNFIEHKSVEVCPIKFTTNMPCPSCGSTRSVISIVNGKFRDALSINPLGYIIAIVMVLIPLWLLIDVLIKKKSLFKFYIKMETYLKKPQLAIPLIVLVLINWIWNITKGL